MNSDSSLEQQGLEVVVVDKIRPFLAHLKRWLESPLDHDVLVRCHDVNETWNALWNFFTIVEAAGGAVTNVNGELLCIFRNDRWDLPKGKIEEGESHDEAAIREVEEECGLTGLELGKELLTTYHTYFHKRRWVLKPTYWYAMKVKGSPALVPQIEEGITKVEWIGKERSEEIIEDTYPSLRNIFRSAW